MLVDNRDTVPLQKKEIPAFICQRNLFSFVNPMRIDNNIALLRLPENFLQADDREHLAGNQICQHLSGTHARQLIHVPDQNQPRPRADRLQQRLKQVDINHRHLIDDNHVRLQRIVLIPFKARLFAAFRHRPGQLKHPVDCPRFVASCLRHPLRRSSGRRREVKIQPFSFKIPDNCVDRRRLTSARSTGQNQNAVADALQNRLPLQLVQHQSLLLLNLIHPF